MPKKIIIDPGHGGQDSGAIGQKNSEEKNINLETAFFIREFLIQNEPDLIIYLTRTQDIFLTLGERAQMANNLGCDIFISIHSNSVNTPSVTGIETYYCPGSIEGKKFAQIIQDILINKFSDHKNRGIKEGNFAVLKKTKMPAILIELEFLSNLKMEEFLTDIENQESLGNAIGQGILNYLG